MLLCLGLAVASAGAVHADESTPPVGKASVMTQVPQMTPISDYQGSEWWSSACAFCSGEIGVRRQALYEKGVAIDVGTTNVLQGVVSGGSNKNWEFNNIIDQTVSLDSGRLDLWPGGLVVLHGRSKLGGSVLPDAGTLSPVNHTALTPVAAERDRWFLEEYYLLQALGEQWSVVLGRLIFAGVGDLNRFAGNEKTQFLDTSLRNSPLLGIISQAHSLHGAAVNYAPNANIILSPFVLSNNDVDGNWGSKGGLFSEVSAGVQLQLSWEIAGRKGYLSPLFGYTTVNPSDLGNSYIVFDLLGGLAIPQKKDNWVVGFSFDHYLYMPEASQDAASHTALFDNEPEGIGVFARFHYAPEDRNPYNVFFSAGLGGRGVVPCRPNDRYGLGFYGLFASSDLKNQPLLGIVLDTEWGMEAFYNFALTPWLQIGPSLQYVQPGRSRIDHTLALATRLQIDF